MKAVSIETAFIRLDSFLKYCGGCVTGGQSKLAILGGLVKVNGECCMMRGKKLRDNDTVEYAGKAYRVRYETFIP